MLVFQEDWKILTVRGVCALLFGAIALLSPDLTLRTLMFLFAAYILLDSAYAYIASGKIRGANRDSRSLPVDVLIGLAAGVFTLIFVAVAAGWCVVFYFLVSPFYWVKTLRATL